MSRSKPTRRLYCSRCKTKYRHGKPKHFNIIVRGRTLSGAADCRCATCGHTYTSNSERARDVAAKLWTPEETRFPNNP